MRDEDALWTLPDDPDATGIWQVMDGPAGRGPTTRPGAGDVGDDIAAALRSAFAEGDSPDADPDLRSPGRRRVAPLEALRGRVDGFSGRARTALVVVAGLLVGFGGAGALLAGAPEVVAAADRGDSADDPGGRSAGAGVAAGASPRPTPPPTTVVPPSPTATPTTVVQASPTPSSNEGAATGPTPKPAAAPSPGKPAAMPAPAAKVDFTRVVSDLHAQRAAAFAAADEDLLAAAFTTGATGRDVDADIIATMRARGLRAQGVRFVVDRVEVATPPDGSGRTRLRVTDRITAYDLVDGDGAVVQHIPAQSAATWTAEVVAVDGGYRFG